MNSMQPARSYGLRSLTQSNVGDMVCGRCGYRGKGYRGRYGGFRCHVCYQLQGGYVPLSVEDEEWPRRVRAAFDIPGPPEPKMPIAPAAGEVQPGVLADSRRRPRLSSNLER